MRIRATVLTALAGALLLWAASGAAYESVAPGIPDEREPSWGGRADLMARIIHQLEQHSGRRFPVLPSETGNLGQAHPGGVIVFDISATALDDAVVAGLLAHEWGHLVLGHPQRVRLTFDQGTLSEQMRIFEREADAYSARFLASWHYDIAPLAEFLAHAPAEVTHLGGHLRHDTGAERATQVRRIYAEIRGQVAPVPAEEPPVCAACQGAEWIQAGVPCPVCGGLGERVCQWCLGNGAVFTQQGWSVCSACGGRGVTVCNRCHGDGSVPTRRPCPVCQLHKLLR